jgi:4-hydroxyphenylpyruvate dioxygenase-like putative hemolysin
MKETLRKLDHIGIAVDNLAESIRFFRLLGFEECSSVILDEIQKVQIIFMENLHLRIELVANTEKSTTVSPWLNVSKIHPYHFAFQVDNFSQAVLDLEKNGFKQIGEPQVAKAFNGSLIAFLISKELFLVEVIEKK